LFSRVGLSRFIFSFSNVPIYIKSKKKGVFKMGRTYTVGRTMEDTPCINIRGKWLRNIGIDLGSKMKLLESDNMIVLLKLPEDEVKRKKLEVEVANLERKLEALKRQLAM
jgi:hypothetical protein